MMITNSNGNGEGMVPQKYCEIRVDSDTRYKYYESVVWERDSILECSILNLECNDGRERLRLLALNTLFDTFITLREP